MAPSTTPNQKPVSESKTPRTPTSNRPSPAKSSSVNGVGRSPSLRGSATRQGRSAMNRSSQQSSLSSGLGSEGMTDDEARAENIALLDELKSRLQRAESASEEYQRQLNLLQARLDESQHAYGQLEDQTQKRDQKIDELEMERSQAVRQNRELESTYEDERVALLREKEGQDRREEEMIGTIQRLKESLAQRDTKGDPTTDKGLPQSPSFAPPTTLKTKDQDDSSKALAQKDRVIESLRMELAESQIKIMEIDSMGGSKLHELERKITEIKVENARLTEDNESYQLLLSEKTLNGEFSKTEAMQSSTGGLGSLAEELGSEELETAEGTEGKSEALRRAELEVKNLKDQNKSLALYIEKIIGRLLQHKDFDTIFDKNPDLMSGAPRTGAVDHDKDLPPPPPPKDEDAGPSLLQRARSVVAGPGKRPRPSSQIIQPAPPPVNTGPPGPNEDPATAPSIPLGRSGSVRVGGHKRTQSDMPNAAPIVNQMYRNPTNNPAPLGSPGLSPSTQARNPFFTAAGTGPRNGPSSGPGSRMSQTTRDGSPSPDHPRPGSSGNSVLSDHSGGGATGPNNARGEGSIRGSPSPSSPPRSAANNGMNNFTGAVMTQNRLRPLRLVQENKEAEQEEESAAAVAARKRANRTSWMPAWMTPSG